MNWKILTIILAFYTHLNAQNVAWDKTENEIKIDALFERWNNSKSTGAVISVVKDEKIIYLQGYGSANLEYGITNEPRTHLFNVASVAKQFTSFCILLLENEGKLSLNDDIRKYIPEVPDFGETITLRHLATHTSGLRDQWNLLKLGGWRMDDVINNEHVFKLIKRQKKLNFKPGDEFRYSNTGHTLLAEVVSRVSGMSFAQYAKKNIFVPLGMYNSLFFDNHELIVENMAYSYDGNMKEGFRKSNLNISSVGATNLYTTAEDMAKWAMNFTNPKVGSFKMIDKLNEVPKLNDGRKSRYALGQYPIEYKGLQAYEHSGAEAAYESYFIRFPKHRFAVAVLSNNGAFWAEGRGREIADIYLKEYLQEEAEPDETTQPKVEIIEISNTQLKKYVGDYWCDSEGLQRAIKFEDGSLWYSRDATNKTQLLPIANGVFVMKDIPTNVQITFKKNSGNIYKMTFSDGTETLDFQPIERTKLVAYRGSYYSEELDTYYYLEAVNERLVASHQRLPDIVLHPISENKFHSRTWFFKNVHFERNDENKIIGFSISNRGVSNLWFKKL